MNGHALSVPVSGLPDVTIAKHSPAMMTALVRHAQASDVSAARMTPMDQEKIEIAHVNPVHNALVRV